MTHILDELKQDFDLGRTEHFDILEYLNLCKTDKMAYATAAERMIAAIGNPVKVDTSKDPRLSRIFLNRTLRTYPAFSDFYGIEDIVENIVGFFKHAAQGLEEKKQILYLLGPVGAAKSSLAERLKELMEHHPIYVLSYVKDPKNPDDLEHSPVFESPLALFSSPKFREKMTKEYGIDKRYVELVLSPWGIKRLKMANGDFSRFRVIKMRPSKLEQIGICKTEPGDENNQDISALVGKTDIRMLEKFSQNDPDAYSFSGGLCRANQGILEFVEMFKAPIKILHPLLTATQESNYMGTEAISAIPFNGIVLAHSNEAEWQTFKNNKNNEAFIDRICIVKVPYCLRKSDEQRIYEKMLSHSDLAHAPCAPHTLDMLAQFSVLTRLAKHENSTPWSKMRVYDGENIKETDPRARSVQEYRDTAGVDEGMNGSSTRFAFKVLSRTFNHDPEEIAADPVHLLFTLETQIIKEQLAADVEKAYLDNIKTDITANFAEELGNQIQTCYLEAYDDFGQNLFERYVEFAGNWIDDIDYKDPDTGNMLNRDALNEELEKIEKPAGISNPKDFRNEIVRFVYRQRAEKKEVKWTTYEKLRKVLEKKMFTSSEELLPIVSFGKKSTAEDESKHKQFVERMKEHGYTPRQTRRLVEWWIRVRKA